MSSAAARKSGRALLRSGLQRVQTAIELVPKRVGQAQVELLVSRHSVLAHADLREGGDLARELFGLFSRRAFLYDAVDQAHLQSLARFNGPAGQDQIQRPAQPDQPWQSNRAAVNQRHAPAAAEDAHYRVIFRDSQ